MNSTENFAPITLAGSCPHAVHQQLPGLCLEVWQAGARRGDDRHSGCRGGGWAGYLWHSCRHHVCWRWRKLGGRGAVTCGWRRHCDAGAAPARRSWPGSTRASRTCASRCGRAPGGEHFLSSMSRWEDHDGIGVGHSRRAMRFYARKGGPKRIVRPCPGFISHPGACSHASVLPTRAFKPVRALSAPLPPAK